MHTHKDVEMGKLIGNKVGAADVGKRKSGS